MKNNNKDNLALFPEMLYSISIVNLGKRDKYAIHYYDKRSIAGRTEGCKR